MANSGSFNTTKYNDKKGLTFSWSVSSQSISGNYTDIYWTLVGFGSDGYHVTRNGYVNIDGVRIWSQGNSVNLYPNTVLASGTHRIYHNNDGSRTFSAEAGAGIYYSAVNCAGMGTWDLPPIARASTPTFGGKLEVGETITIHTNRASTDFTHQLFYSLDGSSWTFLAIGVSDSYAWNVPLEFANNMPNSASATVIISCETFNGDSYIGETRTSFTISIPDTSTFQPYLFDIILSEAVDGIDEQFGIYIQNQSKLNCEVDCFGSFSSTIISCKVVINGVTYNEKTFTTDVLRLAGTNNAVATVTDSRGRKATLTVEFEVAEYQSPTITQFITNRCNEDGSSNEEGEYAKIEVSAIVKRLNDKNPYTYNLQYKKGEEQQYNTYDIELTEVKTDTDITIGGSIVIPASGDYSFDYLFVVSDYFTDNTNKPSDIGTAFQLFNWKENGRGFALGKVSEKDAFEIGMDIYNKDGAIIEAIKVSPTEATNKEKIWLQKGKNLFNGLLETGILDGDTGLEVADTDCVRNIGYIKVKPNTTYTISNNKNYAQYVYEYDENKSFIQYVPNTESIFTFITTPTTKYLRFRTKRATVENDLSTLFQVEQGENATEYEAYVEPTIYVKNDNDVYEEFTNNEKIYVPTTLYNNQNGTTEDITLSESVANFAYIEIFFRNRYIQCSSVKIENPNGKTALLSTFHIFGGTSGTGVAMSRNVNINGNTLHTGDDDQYGEWWTYNNSVTKANNIYITKVVGYR